MNGALDLTPVSLQFVLKKAQFRYQAHVAYPLPELSQRSGGQSQAADNILNVSNQLNGKKTTHNEDALTVKKGWIGTA